MEKYELAWKCQNRDKYKDELKNITTIEFFNADILPIISEGIGLRSVINAILDNIEDHGDYEIQVRRGIVAIGYKFKLDHDEFSIKEIYKEGDENVF